MMNVSKWLLGAAPLALALTAGTARAADAAGEAEAEASSTITVTATRTEKPIEAVPATVTVTTAQMIEDRFVTDIKDLVRYEPGVSVRRAPARFTAAGSATGRDRESGFNIRGLEGNRVLITVDGVRVPDGFSFGAQSVGRGDYVDLDLIKSVEILRGPASALYGSDGVAGAVSFITKDPEDFLKDGKLVGGGVRIGYDSSDESWTKGLVVAGKAGNLQAMLAYTRRDGKELDNKGSNDAANVDRTTPNPQDFDSNALLARLVWAPDDNNRLRFTYERFVSTLDTNVLSAIARPPAVPPLAATATLGLTAADETGRNRATVDYHYSGEGLLSGARIAGYYQKSRNSQTANEDRNTAVDRTRINRFANKVYGGMLQLESELETGSIKHLFVYGADYSHTRQTGVRDGTVPPAGESFPTRAFPTTDYTLTGLFLQDEISIADGRVTIFPSLRYDHYKLDPKNDPLFTAFVPRGQSDSRVTPRIGTVVKLTETIRAFANYTRGFKPPEPNQINNGFTNAVQFYQSIPNPDLKPETSESYEGGLRFNDSHWSLSTTLFSARYRNFIEQVQIRGQFGNPADPAIFQYINLGRVKVHGIEAKGEFHLANGFGAQAAVSYAKGSVRTAGVAGSRPLDSVEPPKFVGGLFYRADDGSVRAEIVATRSSGKKQSRTNASSCGNTACFTPPGFWLVDATIAVRPIEGVTARAGLFNIFDKKYFWWGDVRGLAATSPIRDAYSQPGRNFGLSLSLSL